MPTRKSVAGKVVIVTGATRGIGLALAKALAVRGAQVVATGRAASIARLCAEHPALPRSIQWEALDVTRPEEIERCVARIAEQHGHIDALVNNAGVSIRALVADTGDEDVAQQMAVNFEGPLRMIRAVLPHMQQRRAGRIVTVSSVGGMMAMPCMAMYSASKFAVEGLMESLWYECLPYGIRVSLIQPGFALSGALRHVSWSAAARERIRRDPAHGSAYEAFEHFVKHLYRRFGTDEEAVVRTILKALESRTPRLRYPATADARFFFWVRRLLPRALYHRILYHGLPSRLRVPADAWQARPQAPRPAHAR